jgi:hypothetical protein
MGRFNLSFSAGDEDWFSFRLSAPGMIRISTEGSLDTQLSLYGPNSESEEIESDDDDGDDYNARIARYLNEPGTYYIQVKPYDDDDTGSYTLALESVKLVRDPMEANNRRDQAKNLSIAQLPQNLTLYPDDDLDWFKLDLGSFTYQNGEVVSLYTAGDTDTYMELYERDILIIENDDGADESYNARITFKPERRTDYYVMIRGYDGSTVGEYTLYGETRVEDFDLYEPNNTQAAATSISVGQTLSGNALAEYDFVDWFTFSVTRTGTYAIGTTGGMDTVITLYDSRNTELNQDDDGGKNYNALIETNLEQGTYYAKVSQTGNDYEEYSFFVRQR